MQLNFDDDTKLFDDESLPQASLEIYRYIDESLNNRGEDNNVLRASSAPGCVKKRWYKHHKFKAESLHPRAILTFAFGDLTEALLRAMILEACVGPGKLYREAHFGDVVDEFTVQGRSFPVYDQFEWVYDLDGLKIVSHPDGFGVRNSDGKMELIEIKSAATFSFDRFKRGETPDYIRQVHAMMLYDSKIRHARFFYMNKNTSHIFDRVYEFDDEIASQVIKEFKLSVQKEEPAAPYAKDFLGYPCSYCDYKKACKPGLKVEFTKAGKPKLVLEDK